MNTASLYRKKKATQRGTKFLSVSLLLLITFYASAQISFRPYKTLPVNELDEAQVVAIGDINNDGLNDVVLGTENKNNPYKDNAISVFIQNMQGELSRPTRYLINSGIIGSVTVADINNDSRNDVIVGFSDSVGIFFQNATGSLETIKTYHSGMGVDGIKCGDLNNDGLTDIAVSHWLSTLIRVFYQTPTGLSSATYTKPQAGYDEIDVGDVNGDGLTDVVFMAGQSSGGIHVLTQNGSGRLNNYVSYFPNGTSLSRLGGIAIGDVNNDNKNDVLATVNAYRPNGNITLWEQVPTTGLLQIPPVQVSTYDLPKAIEIADLNCDNKSDIITIHSGWARTSIFNQNDNGDYEECLELRTPASSNTSPYGIAIGDINNDGRKDIAIASNFYGLVTLQNNSKSNSDQVLQSSTKIDTVRGYIYTDHKFNVLFDTFEVNKYLVIARNSVEIDSSVSDDTVKLDSTVITRGNVCGKEYTDTSYFSRALYSFNNISIDTFILSTTKDSINLTDGISIYPNPVDKILKIAFSDIYKNKTARVRMCNTSGELVLDKTQDIKSYIVDFDVSHLNVGMYILAITTEGLGSFSKRIIKIGNK